MKVYVVDLDDGDYYCEGNHMVGIYSTRELAEAAIEKHKKALPKERYEYGIGEWDIDADPELQW